VADLGGSILNLPGFVAMTVLVIAALTSYLMWFDPYKSLPKIQTFILTIANFDQLIAVILGVVCGVLIVIVIGLVTLFFHIERRLTALEKELSELKAERRGPKSPNKRG